LENPVRLHLGVSYQETHDHLGLLVTLSFDSTWKKRIVFKVMNNKRYSKAKTHFVREKIRTTQWKDRHLIDIWLDFEEIISRGGPWQWAQAMAYNLERERYKEEWLAIFKELKPREYKKFLERERREIVVGLVRRENLYKRLAQEHLHEEEDWRKAGGRIDRQEGAFR
jgi:hypothetical protein